MFLEFIAAGRGEKEERRTRQAVFLGNKKKIKEILRKKASQASVLRACHKRGEGDRWPLTSEGGKKRGIFAVREGGSRCAQQRCEKREKEKKKRIWSGGGRRVLYGVGRKRKEEGRRHPWKKKGWIPKPKSARHWFGKKKGNQWFRGTKRRGKNQRLHHMREKKICIKAGESTRGKGREEPCFLVGLEAGEEKKGKGGGGARLQLIILSFIKRGSVGFILSR